MKLNYTTTLLLSAVVAISACKKKVDFSYDNRPVQQPQAASAIRLVNLGGSTELSINGKNLTSFIPALSGGYYGAENTKGTFYFPETGRLGLTYYVPRDLVNTGGYADSIVFTSLGLPTGLPQSRPFRAKDDFNHPYDYYYTRFRPNAIGYMDTLFQVPRGVSLPVNPSNFKIRLLNLSSAPDGATKPGLIRQGAMSVAWADGSLVDGLSNVAPGAWSDYIELPYATLQLKVLEAGTGKEVSGNAGDITIDPNTGVLMTGPNGDGDLGIGGYRNTWLTYAPFKNFQPGGVYTIVVASGYDVKYALGGNGETDRTEANTFRIIADVAEPENTTYARIQGVNAMAGKEVTWQINGKPLGSTLPFEKSTGYEAFITGKYTITAVDKSGTELAHKDWQFLPGDNYTAWLYPDKNGAAAVALVVNNLSGKYYTGANSEDGIYNTLVDGFPTWIRFMNFCPALDEVTFTADRGQQFPLAATAEQTSARTHIQLGRPVPANAYVMMMLNAATPILVYHSTPNVVPGDWLYELPALQSRSFIANTQLYKTPKLPNREPGIYTVALVGNTIADAHMMILKHNK